MADLPVTADSGAALFVGALQKALADLRGAHARVADLRDRGRFDAVALVSVTNPVDGVTFQRVLFRKADLGAVRALAATSAHARQHPALAAVVAAMCHVSVQKLDFTSAYLATGRPEVAPPALLTPADAAELAECVAAADSFLGEKMYVLSLKQHNFWFPSQALAEDVLVELGADGAAFQAEWRALAACPGPGVSWYYTPEARAGIVVRMRAYAIFSVGSEAKRRKTAPE